MGIFGKHRDRDEDWGGSAWWEARSKKDPRFNLSGSAYGVLSGMMEVDSAIRRRAKELGVEPPDDIQISGGKP